MNLKIKSALYSLYVLDNLMKAVISVKTFFYKNFTPKKSMN